MVVCSSVLVVGVVVTGAVIARACGAVTITVVWVLLFLFVGATTVTWVWAELVMVGILVGGIVISG